MSDVSKIILYENANTSLQACSVFWEYGISLFIFVFHDKVCLHQFIVNFFDLVKMLRGILLVLLRNSQITQQKLLQILQKANRPNAGGHCSIQFVVWNIPECRQINFRCALARQINLIKFLQTCNYDISSLFFKVRIRQ